MYCDKHTYFRDNSSSQIGPVFLLDTYHCPSVYIQKHDNTYENFVVRFTCLATTRVLV